MPTILKRVVSSKVWVIGERIGDGYIFAEDDQGRRLGFLTQESARRWADGHGWHGATIAPVDRVRFLRDKGITTG